MLIREATLDDVEDIRKINIETFSRVPTVGFDGMWDKRDLIHFIKSDDFRVYVVELDGQIIGFGMMRVKNINRWFRFDWLENPPIKDWENYAYLMYIAIHPKYQGRGYGKKLLEFIINEAKKLGKRGIFGEFTTATPAAIKLAEDLGGKEICADVRYLFDFNQET